jgi:hypothetical protein
MWRARFVDALQLVGEAAARLPVGVQDPILCGDSAVELYAGGLFATDELELHCSQPRLLIAELFAVGFHWTHCVRGARRGLWQPELQVGVQIGDDQASLGPAERANLLTVAVDVQSMDPVPASLTVKGIEDVISEQMVYWRSHRLPSPYTATRIQVLVALARQGIGGPLRAGYLRRRLAHDTGGEVAFDGNWPGDDTEYDIMRRTMALSSMAKVTKTWCVTHGFAFERASHCQCDRSGRPIGRTDNKAGREGAGIVPARIIPFDGGSIDTVCIDGQGPTS